ncbi:MAG: putative alpha/beta-fold hydrolase [Methylophagaceae bacterium]|jgi:predicted alpha/beta-fold hydrolase
MMLLLRLCRIQSMSEGTIINSKFKTACWLPDRHSQTLFPTLFRKPIPLTLTEEVLELPDGDFVELAWTEPTDSGPIVAVFHGLEGSVDSGYVQGVLKVVHELGWQGVLMHFRTCGKKGNRLPRWYHSGDSPDIDYFIQTLSERYPDRPLGAFGVSLGGNALLKYLGEKGAETPLSSAMAVSVPFDLSNTSEHLTTGFSRVYQRHLIRLVRKKVMEKHRTMALPIDLEEFQQANTFYRVDNVAAKMHGFDSADDYYDKSSARQFLKSIAVPTLILHSRNDPFMTPAAIPSQAELSSKVTLELTKSGGHVGFVYGKNPLKPKYWIDKRFRDFFTSQWR